MDSYASIKFEMLSQNTFAIYFLMNKQRLNHYIMGLRFILLDCSTLKMKIDPANNRKTK